MKPIEKMSNKHKAMAEYIVSNPTVTQKELSKIFDIAQPNISKIYNSPVFKEYIDALLYEQWKGAKKIAQKTMIKLAEEGDRQAAEYILKCNGYVPVDKVELEAQDAIHIKIE